MDWREFFESDEYAAYRQRLAEEIGAYAFMYVSHSHHQAEAAVLLKGGLDMAYKILNIPVNSTTDPKQKERYQAAIRRDMARVAEFIVKERMQA